MDKITLKQFLFTQPGGEVESATDKAYLDLANRLLALWHNRALMQDVPDDLKKVVVIGLMGYYQDVISDAGVYRSFTDEHQRLYGFRVPFHKEEEDYIDYELNRADVEFVLWYLLAFNSMSHRFLNPLDAKLLQLADTFYLVLEKEYEEMPDPDGYTALFDCELHSPESAENLHDLSQWLFWKNWLLLPPFQLTFAQIYNGWIEIQHTASDPQQAARQIEDEKQTAMAQLPTGPLALYLREWLQLILEGKLTQSRREKKAAEEAAKADAHPWYTAFMQATAGKDIAFFPTYEALNQFFINGLGWEAGQEHLPQFKGHENFALMVTRDKGLMAAKDIATCIKHPDNPCYNPEIAGKFAFNLLSQRGVCPGDMLRRLIADGNIPDARFPETDDTTLVAENADFLARAYLQEFYRGD